ncbi:MAG: LacI family DNA-binding transcriptional regulator [Planctomycetales bacterium]|nr:LacI family DNA-binding transcriptional regulator [Planctomycetales bacterium]
MPVSIEDVAKKAGVSISTVSRVINRRNLVNAVTKARVEKAIKELGYRPNVFARGLMLRKSNILGFVLPDIHGEFYSEIIRGAMQKARELGYHLIVSAVTAEDDGQDVLGMVGAQGLVDGMAVMVSEKDSQIRKSLATLDLPLVVLDAELPRVTHDTVLIDQSRGAEAMAAHLLAVRPNDRIIFVGGLETNLDTRDRLQAFRDVLRSAKRQLPNQDVYYLDYSYQTAFDLAYDHAQEWSQRPTTVFAANDEMAAGVISAAAARRVDVPRELRVAGFDDTRIAQLTRPALTTVHVPMADMGATAIELLCDRLEEPDRPVKKVILQAELVVRDSCGAMSLRNVARG